jgi:hypothetical protein
MSMEKNKALQNTEAQCMMEKKALAIEKINAYMQKLNSLEKKFNPLPHFTLHCVLSQISPQFYTKDELTQIEKINQTSCQQRKVKKVQVNSKQRYRPDNEDISDGERIVKSKSAIRRKPIIRKEKTPLSPPPELPNHVNNMITVLNGNDIKYIMCKTLFMSDLSYNNNRLSMPITQIRSDFLTEIEKTILETRDQEGKPVGLKVIVLDPYFNEFPLSLKKWNMSTTSVYNLVQDWSPVLLENNFKENQKLDIWSFRVNDNLYFLLDTKMQEIEKSGEKSKNSIDIKNERSKKSKDENCELQPERV